jgi:hypothetical protein
LLQGFFGAQNRLRAGEAPAIKEKLGHG